jgi:hypothetical protein
MSTRARAPSRVAKRAELSLLVQESLLAPPLEGISFGVHGRMGILLPVMRD